MNSAAARRAAARGSLVHAGPDAARKVISRVDEDGWHARGALGRERGPVRDDAVGPPGRERVAEGRLAGVVVDESHVPFPTLAERADPSVLAQGDVAVFAAEEEDGLAHGTGVYQIIRGPSAPTGHRQLASPLRENPRFPAREDLRELCDKHGTNTKHECVVSCARRLCYNAHDDRRGDHPVGRRAFGCCRLSRHVLLEHGGGFLSAEPGAGPHGLGLS